MALIDFATILEPLSDEAPCGPDLDAEGDIEFMTYLARAESLLPASYFDLEDPDKPKVNYVAEMNEISVLAQRTRDLRLLVLYAKFAILGNDIPSFTDTIKAVAALMRERWAEVYPRDIDGDFIDRVATVQALEDAPHVLFPLQFARLVTSRRSGPITYRSWLLAQQKVTPREQEAVLDASTIERVMSEVELPTLIDLRDRMLAVEAAATSMDKVSVEKAGYDNRISIEKLGTLAHEIAVFLDEGIARRDPLAAVLTQGAPAEESFDDDSGGEGDAARPDGAPRPAGSTAAIQNHHDARAALRAAIDYYRRHEPSSAALLVAQFAEGLVGKSFYEVMQALVPDHASYAALLVGQKAVRLPAERLAEMAQIAAAEAPPIEEDESPESEKVFLAVTRREAMTLFDQVAGYYRAKEPASPLAMLLQRARDLSERDFSSLMGEFFAESTLRAIRGED
ncbi:type VI secretion system protein TssA [Prosthecomicrobium sp. N25]|uniref:type VI secretion system protein TssA n=1 Tax=Prosthecomicrobium sp. N25 TaxID=3129254 RepID=UPI003076E71B